MKEKFEPSKIVIAPHLEGKLYYIYIHIRLDNKQPFYVGRGKIPTQGFEYRRSKSTNDRNNLWIKIVKKAGYKVLICSETFDLEEIMEYEKTFIKLFGKVKDRTGTLCNMTDGGDGSLGLKHTEESKRKMSLGRLGEKNHRFGVVTSEETIKKIKQARGGRCWFREKGVPHPSIRAVIKVDINTNEIISEYSSLKETDIQEGLKGGTTNARIHRGSVIGNYIFKHKNNGN